MNPIQHYEKVVQDAWQSRVVSSEKVDRLLQAADSIDNYVQRSRRMAPPTDPLHRCTVERGFCYLEMLANDARSLAAGLHSELATEAQSDAAQPA